MLEQPIETQRLVIRRFASNDWSEVCAYATNPQVMNYVEEGPLSESQLKVFVEQNMGEEAKAFPVILKTTQHLIGHMIFHLWFAPRMYEIGWVLHPAYHGQGYAPEAARALLHHGFTELQAHRIIATCQPENRASYRVMEKIGLRREGHFRQCIQRAEGVWWDEYFMPCWRKSGLAAIQLISPFRLHPHLLPIGEYRYCAIQVGA